MQTAPDVACRAPNSKGLDDSVAGVRSRGWPLVAWLDGGVAPRELVS
jgi:hypothetical protein